MAVYTQDGEEYICDLIDGSGATHLDKTNTWIGWGTSSAAENKSNSALTAEYQTRVITGTKSQPVADKNQWQNTRTATGSQDIKEAGLFTAVSGGTLVVRGIFATIPVLNNDQIQFTISLEQA